MFNSFDIVSKTTLHFTFEFSELIAKESSHYYNNSIYNGYTLGKDEFINKIIAKTGFDKFRFVFAAHQKERQEILNIFSSKKDFENEKYVYFCLYKGVKIIAVASIDITENKMETIFLDNTYKTEEADKYFTNLCNKWLKLRLLF